MSEVTILEKKNNNSQNNIYIFDILTLICNNMYS